MNTKKLNKLFTILRSKDLSSGLFSSIAATTEHLPLLKSIGNIQTVIDIGANKGQFTLIARYVFSDATIISFEPLSLCAEKFNKFFSKDQNIIFHQSAIGPINTTQSMHVSKLNDSSSLFPISNRQSTIFPGTEESHIEEIKVAPLHQFLSKEDLLDKRILVKIDVQGYELDVLKGCEYLMHLFDFIYVECSFIELYKGQALAYEVIKYLNNQSFELKGIYNTFYNKSDIAVQSDFLFQKVDENF